MSIKSYFTWAPKLPKKPCYDMDEVMEDWEHRKKCTFENHYLNIYYSLYRFFRNFSPSYMRGYIRRAYQLCTRGWSDRDLWSLDYTIAKFALPRLIELKKQMHGVPNSMFPTLPEGEYEYSKEQTEQSITEWNETLEEIIFAMDFVANCREYDYHPKKDWPERPTKEDYAELLAVEKRVQEGFILFGTHFRSLWD